ncbi:DUF6538 domain-containing protein [Bradyrhizobium diazoefficiens]|uniref:DUF6538 domain-containing protein n=2 Tax=Bradyrhizobium diazoefficiens TaxID=1355477 RepID=UPI0015B3D12B|nr:DUF6538 domain-containing protein [Bradyrhizobium diazoefficiens]QLD44371.1 integrase [Bradyrhizobium diazoefficiens]
MDSKYLVKQHNTYSVVVEIPKRLQAKAGQKRFKKSLQTDSLAEANRLKHHYVHGFQRKIAELEKGGDDTLAALYRDASEWKPTLASARTATEVDEQGREIVEREEYLSVIKEQASQIAELHGKLVGDRYLATATGTGTIIKDQIDAWIAESPDAGQTKSQHRSTVERYLKWAGEFATVEETDRVKAGQYVTELLTVSGLARRTIRRHLSSLSNLWLWVESKGAKLENVWHGHRLGKKKRGTERKGLSDEKVIKLLNGRSRSKLYGPLLCDLTRLALLHGARLEELCALKKADVTEREDGYWFVIGEGKTEAAQREIPVHPTAAKIIERRLKGEDEWLFEGLTPGGPDEKRSWYVSKAFGRFRAQDDVKVDGRLEDRAGPGCLDSAPLDLSGFLPGYAERGALRFCRCVGRA